MASSDSQIDKPQCGRPKCAELPDVNINTGAQSINSESFIKQNHKLGRRHRMRNIIRCILVNGNNNRSITFIMARNAHL